MVEMGLKLRCLQRLSAASKQILEDLGALLLAGHMFKAFMAPRHRIAGMEQILTLPEANKRPSYPRFLSFLLARGLSDLPLAPGFNALFHPFLPPPAFVPPSVGIRLFFFYSSRKSAGHGS